MHRGASLPWKLEKQEVSQGCSQLCWSGLATNTRGPNPACCVVWFFFFIYLKLKANYNIVLVSAIHQHGSAMDLHMFPPSWAFLPPPIPSQPSRLSLSPGLTSLSHTANSHWLSILHMIVYMCPWYCLHSSHPLLPIPLPPHAVYFCKWSVFGTQPHAFTCALSVIAFMLQWQGCIFMTETA